MEYYQYINKPYLFNKYWDNIILLLLIEIGWRAVYRYWDGD